MEIVFTQTRSLVVSHPGDLSPEEIEALTPEMRERLASYEQGFAELIRYLCQANQAGGDSPALTLAKERADHAARLANP